MNIELVRHFKVDYKFKKHQNSTDIITTCNDYDKARIKNTFLIRNKYKKIYISTLTRTEQTSEYLANKETVNIIPLLNELTMNPIIKTNIKLPFILFFILWKFCWSINSSLSNETRKQTRTRINVLLDKLENENEDITIVGHAHIFSIMLKELKSRNYRGKYKPIFFNNGEIREFIK